MSSPLALFRVTFTQNLVLLFILNSFWSSPSTAFIWKFLLFGIVRVKCFLICIVRLWVVFFLYFIANLICVLLHILSFLWLIHQKYHLLLHIIFQLSKSCFAIRSRCDNTLLFWNNLIHNFILYSFFITICFFQETITYFIFLEKNSNDI